MCCHAKTKTNSKQSSSSQTQIWRVIKKCEQCDLGDVK